ncbi:MAG: aspartate--tRNA ligase [Candidatus Firestonebacteria bacterium RIFOXYA2_FULL_40_8]|nr:MAG: aspartate--tRNA ligase [Candidatus Firestonebacteria bacterium RIFOXYA2_FULL_40_8]
MFNNFQLRHKVTFLVREYLDKQGFLDVETPILLKSTPEGARDYLVPSRVNPGEFYALPQSPQMLKQTLMISGFDKYFQIAKCFRDEDLRADRQPEFTQIDIEMSFIEEEDIMSLTEGMISYVFKNALNMDLKTPFRRLTYDEAMGTYGTDKPDLRFDLPLVDITGIAKNAEYKIFASVAAAGGVIKGLNAKKCGSFSRMEIDKLIEFVKTFGAKGMSWFKVENGKMESNLTKFFSEQILSEMKSAFKAEDGDLILVIADKPSVANQALDFLRRHLGEKLNLIDKDAYCLEWITDFPLFGWNEEEKRFDPLHHPFTSPKAEDLKYFGTEPGRMKARAYDLVLNGLELGGGSIRIHTRDVQEKMFKAIGITDEQAKERFGFLLEAFEFGAPPHGGIAFGLDRIMMLLLKESSIRDVIVFPKTQKAQCLLSGAPSKVEEKQLKELHIKTIEILKKEEKISEKAGNNPQLT